MSTLITIIIINYKLQKVTIIIVVYGVMVIKFVAIDCFLCNSNLCMLFESLSHMITQESHLYSWNLGKIYLVHFFEILNLPRFTRETWKFQKSELGKFIPNFPLKHVITSTNHMAQWNLFDVVNSVNLKLSAVLKFPADDL